MIPTSGTPDIPLYGSLVYRGLYDGIDLRYLTVDGALEERVCHRRREPIRHKLR